jgi:hypothetical protein
MRSASSSARTLRRSSPACTSPRHVSERCSAPCDVDWLTHTAAPCRQIEAKQYRDALALIEGLLKEVKRLDDKLILTEVHLLESRANGETANWPKAKVRCLR